jgi:hypothetical protein
VAAQRPPGDDGDDDGDVVGDSDGDGDALYFSQSVAGSSTWVMILMMVTKGIISLTIMMMVVGVATDTRYTHTRTYTQKQTDVRTIGVATDDGAGHIRVGHQGVGVSSPRHSECGVRLALDYML